MEAFMEKKNVEIQAINRQTFSQRLKSYKRSPLSLLLLILGQPVGSDYGDDAAVFDCLYSD